MRYTIKIQMDNAAFGDDNSSRANEVDAVLQDLIQHSWTQEALFTGSLHDTNGNKVGTAKITRT